LHARKNDAGVILPMGRKVGFTKIFHELFEGHPLKMWTIQFDPADEMDILDTIKSTLNDLISRNVFVVGIFPTSVFPINIGLGVWVTCMHIWGFRVGLLFNYGNSGSIEFGKDSRQCATSNIMRWRKV
jgi:hypothetical protein